MPKATRTSPLEKASLQVLYRALADLTPYAQNARTHSDDQVAQIAKSIQAFGFTNPVLIDERGGIIAGHGRVMAAKRLGMTNVPTIALSGLSDEQRRAYVIADNKLALNAGWDHAMLTAEIDALQLADFDVSVLGFSDAELAALAPQTVGLTDPDDAPPLAEHPVSRLGDVWLLGRHRIVCGDCTDPETVAAACDGVEPHLMVTDPPYGVNYDPKWRQAAGVGSAGAATGVVLNDHRADWRAAWELFPGAVAYVWHGGLHARVVAESLEACNFGLRAQIIWVKTRPALSRGHYHWQHEPAFYGVRQDCLDDQWRFVPEHEVTAYAVRVGATAAWEGGRKQSTVWFIEHLKSDTGHGTQKPVECMKRPIENNSSPGQAVYEPFSGSGTTIIACEMTGRSCHAIELNPAYVDMAVKRWQAFTGLQATLEDDGRTFDEVSDREPAEA